MRFSSQIVPILCLKVISGNFNNMNSDIVKGVNKVVTSQEGLDVYSEDDRALSTIFGTNLNDIKDSGCHCYFDEDYEHGKGTPVNAIDAICKQLSEGYTCAIYDVLQQSGDPNCKPWEVVYTIGHQFGLDLLESSCIALNSDLCSRYACMVEGSFTINAIQQFLTAGAIVPGHKISNGFDFNGICGLPNQSNSKTGHAQDRECCGPKLARYMFNSGSKECCGAVTYNPSLLICCPDDVPRATCI